MDNIIPLTSIGLREKFWNAGDCVEQAVMINQFFGKLFWGFLSIIKSSNLWKYPWMVVLVKL